MFWKKKKDEEPKEKKKVSISPHNFEELDNLPDRIKKELSAELAKLVNQLGGAVKPKEEVRKETQDMLEHKGVIIKLDVIPTFIDFVYNNMQQVGKLTGTDKNDKQASAMKSFLETQEELFLEHVKNGGNHNGGK